MLLRPGGRHRDRMQAGFLGDLEIAFGSREALVVDEAASPCGLPPFHLDIAREARAPGGRAALLFARYDPKSVVSGKGVSVRVTLGGRRSLKKNKTKHTNR